MKKNDLIKLIRSAVRAELNECLPKMLSEIVSTQAPIKKTKSDPLELTKSVLENVQTEEVKPTKPQKIFSKNEALNRVLNETVGGIPAEGSKVGNGNTMTDLQGNQVDVEALPDHLSNALTRNYSDVLKLVDKKRGKV